MAKNINVYCHAIYFNGETRNITTKNGRIYAACFTTPDSNYQPTLPAIDCHVNENIKTTYRRINFQKSKTVIPGTETSTSNLKNNTQTCNFFDIPLWSYGWSILLVIVAVFKIFLRKSYAFLRG